MNNSIKFKFTFALAFWMAGSICSNGAGLVTASKPTFLHNLKEVSRVVKLPDGKLLAVFTRNAAEGPELVARYSTDNGQTWGDMQSLTSLEKDDSGWGSPEPLVDQRGELQIFFLKSRKKQPSGLDIDIWHCKSTDGRTHWRAPRRIWAGYTGSLNCVIQMRSGRILLPFSYMTKRTWAKRGDGFDAFTYMGTFDCTVLYSDDQGDTWQLSPSQLKVTAPDLSTYGAIEPVVVERKDGQVWMLLRTQHGRFYESLSKDGATWSKPQPTRIFSSDSPAGLVRLDDGRIAMFWNNCLRFPYAYGGRHVMHGAISADDGKTWRGFREVARNPRRDEPPPPTGDHGATYPIPCAVGNGCIITSTGLPTNYNLFIDPAWFYQTEQKENFANGLDQWSVFGVKGVELSPHPDKPDARVLSLGKLSSEWPAAAVWNFPSGIQGRLRLRILLKPGFGGARIGITDHYSVPFDELDEFYNLYNLVISSEGKIGKRKLTPNRWHTVELRWDTQERECRASVDGHQAGVLQQSRPSLGANYLRLVSTAEMTDPAGLLIEAVEVKVSPE
jgi:hypothetical protein